MTDRDPLAIVLDLLKVERLEVDLFRGISPDENLPARVWRPGHRPGLDGRLSDR